MFDTRGWFASIVDGSQSMRWRDQYGEIQYVRKRGSTWYGIPGALEDEG